MAPQKETIMVLKVDLDCYRCYTKVKRLLCCYPQIQDQIYNEKQNTVTIKVVCCTPEKIRDKLAAKAGKSIKGIQIVELKKPAADKPPAEKPASKPKDEAAPPKQGPPPADKPPKQAAPADKPPKDAAPADKPPKDAGPKPAGPADEKPPMKKNGSKNGSKNGGDKPQGEAPPPAAAAAKPPKDAGGAAPPKPADQAASMVRMMPPEMIQCYPGYPLNAAYEYGNGYGYGYGYAAPPPPPPAGWGYGGPSGYGYEGGYKPTYSSNRYGDYISDENPTGCVVM